MNDPITVNYQSLEGMHHATRHVFVHSLKTPIGIVAFVGLVIGIVGLGIVVKSPFLIFAGPVGYFVYIGYLSQRYRNTLWDLFAAANNWPLDTTTSILEIIPPSMQFGHSDHFSPVIKAQLGNIYSDLFSYSTTVGSGKYQHTYEYTVGRVQLPVELPHMLLLSKKAGAELQRDLTSRQDVQLEGDFDDYFKLQIEQGQQVDALTVITPDVMQILVEYNQAEDIEILSDDLYFIMGADNRGPERVRRLIDSVVALSTRIIENISHEQSAETVDAPNSVTTG